MPLTLFAGQLRSRPCALNDADPRFAAWRSGLDYQRQPAAARRFVDVAAAEFGSLAGQGQVGINSGLRCALNLRIAQIALRRNEAQSLRV